MQSSLDAFPGNLPIQLTSFVGRDDELAALVDMMGNSRLVTLTGVGGVGKTRLALQAAAELLPSFRDGVWFCELAAASDELLMFQAVADALGARQREGMSLADSIVEFLRNREVLIVLDNCEHLLAGAAWLASEILATVGDDVLAATCAGVVQSETITTFRSLPQTDRTAARVADRMGTDQYHVAFGRGASLTYLDVAPTLIRDLGQLLQTA
jgi:predicted ATPase